MFAKNKHQTGLLYRPPSLPQEPWRFLEQVNYWSRLAFWAYHPTEPLDTHLLQLALGCLTRVSVNVSIAAVLAAIVSSSYSKFFVSVKLRELFNSAKPQIANYRIWSDAILIGFTAALVSAGLSSINEYLTGICSTAVPLTRLRPIALLDQSSLALASILQGIQYGFLFLFLSAAILRWSDFYANPKRTQPAEKSADREFPDRDFPDRASAGREFTKSISTIGATADCNGHLCFEP